MRVVGRRLVEVSWRVARHEWTLAAVAALVLAVVLTWPTLRDPASTIPQDTGDPTLQAWQVAWGGHALLTNPFQVWHSNTFYPEPYTYAYSDTLLGYAPFGMIGDGPVAAVVRYNLLYVLTHALALFGAYALARQLGAGRAGSAVAGVSFAYAPWKLAQAGHLHVLSIGGIALALAMLARGHGWSLRHGHRPDRIRPGWVVAGWATAAWQVTLGFGIGLPFAYALGLICLGVAVTYGVVWWRRRSRPAVPRGLLLADLAGGIGFAGVTLAMAAPYFEVVARNPSGRRTVAQIEMFSPSWRGFITAPPESWLWGERHEAARATLGFPGEMTLLPGVVLLSVAMAGIFFSAWRLRHRLMLAGAALVSVALAAGTTFGGDGDPGYVTLVEHAPGWDGVRTPGRLVLWTTLLLGLLAAGALTVREPAVGRARDPLAEPAPGAGPAGEALPEPASGTGPAREQVPGSAARSGPEPAEAERAAREPVGAVPAAREPADVEPAAAEAEPVGAEPVGARPTLRPAAWAEAGAPARPTLRPAAWPAAQAAQAVDPEPAREQGGQRWRLARLALLVPLLLVMLEGVNRTPHVPAPEQPAVLRGLTGPALVLPSDGIRELHVMLWSTDGFPKVVNGLASFTPQSQERIRAASMTFPDATSVAYLREVGLRTVVLLPGWAPGTPWADVAARPVDGLGISREMVGEDVIYRL
ncbi:hypothetical protein [Micromonospora sp. WMMD987]|uniref:hypothetical protein n=1 Tax=Micromonospora sp. WMMD987 TaxID=3016089 RepID=UPI00249A9CAA|nr:hypothetical protein [Micromonospora sp. WMMD987]WFE98280.1 hypothetical protein O7612_22900 [Micromonospora sp. WMMD987]